MIEIRHKTSAAVLAQVDAETLRDACFFEHDLTEADFKGINISGADFTLALLRDADFSGARCLQTNFYSAILRGANLSDAALGGIEAEGTDLRDVNLCRAKAHAAYLRHACLANADLREIDLTAANLAHANLQKVDLSGSDLTETILQRTHLVGANLAGATLKSTIFAECITLHKALGLDQILHTGPSSLDQSTLRACSPDLPDVFLRGVGYSDDEVQSLRRLYS